MNKYVTVLREKKQALKELIEIVKKVDGVASNEFKVLTKMHEENDRLITKEMNNSTVSNM